MDVRLPFNCGGKGWLLNDTLIGDARGVGGGYVATLLLWMQS